MSQGMGPGPGVKSYLTRTNLGHWDGWAAGNSFTTGSFKPPDNCLLEIDVFWLTNGGTSDDSANITITDSLGSHLVYNVRANIGDPNYYASAMAKITAPVTTGATMTVTVASSNLPWVGANVDIVAYNNYNTGSPVGATASSITLPPTGAGSLTLSSAPAAGSEVNASIWVKLNSVGTGVIVKGSGWTELYNDSQGTNYGLAYQTQVRSASTSTNVPWADTDNAGAVAGSHPIGLAIEIKSI